MTMRERPILFSGPMIHAILEGRKTQTRRIMQVQPPGEGYQIATCMSTTGDKRNEGRHHWVKADGVFLLDGDQSYFSCPHGVPGDRLWVRETAWYPPRDFAADILPAMPQYDADVDAASLRNAKRDLPSLGWKHKSSIFMPRWASRILLDLVSVRIERVQEITEEDAKAEGAECVLWHGDKAMQYENQMPVPTYRAGFANLWDTLNAKRGFGWDMNPFVWVLAFRRLA